MEIFVGVLRGMGYSVIPMVVTFFGACVLRVVWVFTVFAKFHRLTILYISYPISWIITLLADGLIFVIVYKRLLEKSKIEEELASVEETKKEEEIVAKEKEAQELKRKYFGPEGELYKKRESLMAPIQDEIYNAIKEISDAKGFSVVVDRASATSVIYASPKIDISNEVLIKLGYAN
jgi:hypothetical protein